MSNAVRLILRHSFKFLYLLIFAPLLSGCDMADSFTSPATATSLSSNGAQAVSPTPAPTAAPSSGVSGLNPDAVKGSSAGTTNGGIGGINVTCEAPPAGASGTIFYVDAVNGSASGDGSAAHPWQSLTTVLNTKVATATYVLPFFNSAGNAPANGAATKAVSPGGPVRAGDTIYLMSGNYGAISITDVNSDFITIMAAPGQSPVLSSLWIVGSSKWIFRGLKIQETVGGATLVDLSWHNYHGPIDNIVLDHNVISGIDDASVWTTGAIWQAQAPGAGIMMDGGPNANYANCLTLTNNTIENVKIGARIGASHTTFDDNTIDNFGDDAMDYNANDIVISRNFITNSNTINDGNHNDCMQGQVGRGTAWRDILIDSNKCVRQTDPNLSLPGGFQGIDAFDNDWTNITIRNNVIITNTMQALSLYSVHYGLIINNTVLWDGGTTLSLGSTSGGGTAWIWIGSQSHEGSPSNDVIVRNNLATTMEVKLGPSQLTLDHNVSGGQMSIVVNGNLIYPKAAGVYGDDNTIAPTLNTNFVDFDPTHYLFNVQLAASSPYIGAGSADQAPALDITGQPRTHQTIGAYD